MISAAATLNEPARVATLRAYDILDTPDEEIFDQITSAAAKVCEMPMSLITLVDGDRQWFKSRHRFHLTETRRDISFCAHAIQQRDTFTIENAEEDERTRDNPLVTGEPHLRSYAGKPLLTPEGHALGTLCVLDTKPRRLTEAQKQALSRLALSASRLLVLRKQYKGAIFAKAVDASNDGIVIADVAAEGCPILWVNKSFVQLTGVDFHEAIGNHFMFPIAADSEHAMQFETAKQLGETATLDLLLPVCSGRPFWDRIRLVPYLDGSCKPICMVVVHRDVTVEKELDAERQKLHAMSTTMRSVSHIVRNFMNAAQLYRGQVLTARPLDPTALRIFDEAMQTTRERLASIERMNAFKERTTPFGFSMLDTEP